MHRNPRVLLRAAATLLRPTTTGAPQTLPNAAPAPLPLALRRALLPGHRRAFSTDYSKDVDEVNRKFAEAREEIESAMDSKETVYFNEEAACARDAANEVLGAFDALLARVPPADADKLRRSMGLKMEQLKAELKQLEE
jgi:DNA-binding IclR family transcriptional regulator